MRFVTFLDIFGSLADFFSGIPEMLLNGVVNALKYVFGLLFYLISIAICKLVQIMYGFFAIFSGMRKVRYGNDSKYLVNVFFENPSISKAYWGFAVISFVLIFVFVIAAVVRKLFDLGEKQKESYSEILLSAGKAVFVILIMSFIMNISLNVTNVLMQRIAAIFEYAETGAQEPYRAFSDDEFATMNNVLETIGNFSLNPSYTNRYNINACFNAIREDLLELEQAGVFEYDYYRFYLDTDNEEVEIPNWQGALQKISKAADLKSPLQADAYNDKVSAAIIGVIDIMNNYRDFAPLQSVRSTYNAAGNDALDVILFMTGTANAAQNSKYNVNATITDAVRGPYFTGQRSIYNYDNVTDDFDIKLGGIDYVIIIVLSALMAWQLFGCIMSCAVRIFNLMLIYLLAPPFAATIPWDSGQKFKSWTQALTVQLLNVFGTVICMRLLMLYIPIILGDKLILFDDGFLNLVGKAILIYAGVVACSRGADLFSGILTGNGASASASAGNMTAMSNSLFGGMASSIAGTATGVVKGAVRKTVGTATGAVKGVAGVAGGALADLSGVSGVKQRLSEKWQRMTERGGIIGSLGGGLTRDERADAYKRNSKYFKQKEAEDEAKADRKRERLEAQQTEKQKDQVKAKADLKAARHKEIMDAIRSNGGGGSKSGGNLPGNVNKGNSGTSGTQSSNTDKAIPTPNKITSVGTEKKEDGDKGSEVGADPDNSNGPSRPGFNDLSVDLNAERFSIQSGSGGEEGSGGQQITSGNLSDSNDRKAEPKIMPIQTPTVESNINTATKAETNKPQFKTVQSVNVEKFTVSGVKKDKPGDKK